MKRRKQFSLAVLFLGVLVASVIFAVIRYNLPSQRYRRNGDEESLRTLLSRRVVSGDSQESVSSLLGGGKLEEGVRSSLLKWQSGPRVKANVFPEGIEEDDVFISFEQNPRVGRLVLQFRNGKLVNFDPTEFAGVNNTIDAMPK
jgi:hypothetical protein